MRGVTSNLTIFEKAIDSSDDYSDQLREQAERQKSASEIYEALAVRDIQMAADLLAPVFEKTRGTDGFVSLECSPLLAHDTSATIEEVRHLWRVLNRKNVMIKIPATNMGNSKNITNKTFNEASQAAGQSAEEAKKNTLELLQKTLGAEQPPQEQKK